MKGGGRYCWKSLALACCKDSEESDLVQEGWNIWSFSDAGLSFLIREGFDVLGRVKDLERLAEASKTSEANGLWPSGVSRRLILFSMELCSLPRDLDLIFASLAAKMLFYCYYWCIYPWKILNLSKGHGICFVYNCIVGVELISDLFNVTTSFTCQTLLNLFQLFQSPFVFLQQFPLGQEALCEENTFFFNLLWSQMLSGLEELLL